MSMENTQTTSIWMETAHTPDYAPLTENKKCDVVIIGAGIAGLTTGYFLAKAGKKVIILEKDSIGSGETGRTTAHLTNVFDNRYTEMEKIHGEERTKLLAQSHTAAIEMIETIVREEGIACDFRRVSGYLIAGKDSDLEVLKEERKAVERAGLSVHEVSEVPYFEELLDNYALAFADQGEIHALKYLSGLAQAFVKAGGEIYLNSRVYEIKEDAQVNVSTDRATVTASQLLFASNSPLNQTIGVHSKQIPFRTYVIGLKIPSDCAPDSLIWDTLEPYHYVRTLKAATNPELGENDVLIVGGEDHRTGEEVDVEARYKALEKWTRAHFPKAGEVVYHWSGQVMEPLDGIALIGKNQGSENVYIITGDSGNGMTHGTLGGKLICDLITGKENAWSEVYDPSRLRLKALKEYIKGGVSMAQKYTRSVEKETVDKGIKNDEGAVIEEGKQKLAIYRDRHGKLHKRSAICPHMGCLVAWNEGEKSFDCPCHGSRFDGCGKAISGPTLGDLKPCSSKKSLRD